MQSNALTNFRRKRNKIRQCIQAHCCQRRARIKYGGERERYFRKWVTARCRLGALASRPATWAGLTEVAEPARQISIFRRSKLNGLPLEGDRLGYLRLVARSLKATE